MKAAIKIQSIWRMHNERTKYRALQTATVIVQKLWRGKQARNLAKQMRAARTIQVLIH
jgi:surface antigen